jgi:hypothetical protein
MSAMLRILIVSCRQNLPASVSESLNCGPAAADPRKVLVASLPLTAPANAAKRGDLWPAPVPELRPP